MDHRAEHPASSPAVNVSGHEIAELLADRAHKTNVADVMVTHGRAVLNSDRILEMVDGRLSVHALVN